MTIVGIFGHFWVLKSIFEQKISFFRFYVHFWTLKNFRKQGALQGAIGRNHDFGRLVGIFDEGCLWDKCLHSLNTLSAYIFSW